MKTKIKHFNTSKLNTSFFSAIANAGFWHKSINISIAVANKAIIFTIHVQFII